MSQGTYQRWGKRIRDVRGQRSQTWLAKYVGVNQSTVSAWERGTAPISDEYKVAVAGAFGLWVGDLFPWEDLVRPPRRAGREELEEAS